MIYQRSSRRHFLQGLGGLALALPTLPSLMSRAEAQAITTPRFFISFWISHGGISVENTYPIPSTVSLTNQTLYAAQTGLAAHVGRHAKLLDLKRTHAQTAAARTQALPDYDAGSARVSPLLGSFIPDSILAKMNLLEGVDFLTWGGHTRGFLGNFINNDGNAESGIANLGIPTIDYVISQSNKFYSAADRLLMKVPVLANTGYPDSGQLSTFRSGTGVAANPYTARTVGEMYDRLFQGVQTTPGVSNPKAAIVDRVHADYSRLSKGAHGPGRLIGKDDRVRLGEYMDNLADISTRMKAMVTASCTVPTVTMAQRSLVNLNGEADSFNGSWVMTQQAAMQLQNMLLVNAFQCGSTRIHVRAMPPLRNQFDASLLSASQLEANRTDPHGMVFHNHFLPDRQRLMMETQRFFFEHSYIDLAKRLDAITLPGGKTMLDQSVMYWGSESGPETHNAKCLPSILAGSGGGYFNTGNYVDYTNRARQITAQYGGKWYAGLPQNRLLANFAQAMGLAPDDYELADGPYGTKFPTRAGKVPGYGDPHVQTTDNPAPYLSHHVNDMSEPLPIIKA